MIQNYDGNTSLHLPLEHLTVVDPCQKIPLPWRQNSSMEFLYHALEILNKVEMFKFLIEYDFVSSYPSKTSMLLNIKNHRNRTVVALVCLLNKNSNSQDLSSTEFSCEWPMLMKMNEQEQYSPRRSYQSICTSLSFFLRNSYQLSNLEQMLSDWKLRNFLLQHFSAVVMCKHESIHFSLESNQSTLSSYSIRDQALGFFFDITLFQSLFLRLILAVTIR